MLFGIHMSLESKRIQEILDTKNTLLLTSFFKVLCGTLVGHKVKELESSLTT